MLRIIIIGIVVYLFYRFLTRFLIPLAKLVKMTHHDINDVRQRMQQKTQRPPRQEPKQNKSTPVDGEYIDYEEVK